MDTEWILIIAALSLSGTAVVMNVLDIIGIF